MIELKDTARLAQFSECCLAMGLLIPHFRKLDILVHASNSRTQEVKAGKAEVQIHPYLYSKFEAIPGYVRPDSKEFSSNLRNTIA